MNRLFKLINSDIVFGNANCYDSKTGEILIEKPYTANGSGILPYTSDVLGTGPDAIIIHPMNVLWSVPLDEYEHINSTYNQVITGIITDTSPALVV